jgi:hypothetical protein
MIDSLLMNTETLYFEIQSESGESAIVSVDIDAKRNAVYKILDHTIIYEDPQYSGEDALVVAFGQGPVTTKKEPAQKLARAILSRSTTIEDGEFSRELPSIIHVPFPVRYIKWKVIALLTKGEALRRHQIYSKGTLHAPDLMHDPIDTSDTPTSKP